MAQGYWERSRRSRLRKKYKGKKFETILEDEGEQADAESGPVSPKPPINPEPKFVLSGPISCFPAPEPKTNFPHSNQLQAPLLQSKAQLTCDGNVADDVELGHVAAVAQGREAGGPEEGSVTVPSVITHGELTKP